jgi:hypothetical protein
MRHDEIKVIIALGILATGLALLTFWQSYSGGVISFFLGSGVRSPLLTIIINFLMIFMLGLFGAYLTLLALYYGLAICPACRCRKTLKSFAEYSFLLGASFMFFIGVLVIVRLVLEKFNFSF